MLSWILIVLAHCNSRTQKVLKSDITLGLPFMVYNLVHEFQIICMMGT